MNNEKFVNIVKLMTTCNFEIRELPDNLKCAKCKLVLKDACQVPCGCTFCRVCINDMMVEGSEFCPGILEDCPKSLLQLFQPDHKANNNVSRLTAKCAHNGCVHHCQLANMADHLRECPKRNVECPFRESGCQQDKFLAEEMNEHLHQEHLSHSKILIGMIANMNQDIEMLKQKAEDSRIEIDMLKQGDNSIRRKIEILMQRDENNKKEIELLKKRDGDSRREIDMLKRDLSLKDEQIRGIMNQTVQSKDENKSITSSQTPTKQEVDNLIDRVQNLSAKLDREIDQSEKTHKLDIYTIGKLDKEISGTKILIKSHKDEITRETKSMKNDIQSLNQGAKLMMTGIDSMKSQLRSLQALVGLVDASCEWMIEKNVSSSSWDKGSIRNDCFIGEKRPYKYQLASWNGNGSLWVMLRIFVGSNDGQLAWPFEGRVVITVADKKRREACRRISRQCKIKRPEHNDCTVSDYFKFSHSELTGAGLNLCNGLCVSCVIVSIAGV